MAINIFDDEQSAREEAGRHNAEQRAEKERNALEEARKKAVDAMEGVIARIHKQARRADDALARRDETRQRLKDAVRANADLSDGDPLRVVGQLMVVALSVPAAYAFDYFLFSSFVGYLLSFVDAGPVFLFWARLITPAVVISLEMVVATLMYGARQKAGTWRSPSVIAWTTLAVMTLIGLSLMTAATIIAGEQVESLWDMTLAQLLLMVPTTVFAAVPHAILLFGGRLAYEGKAMFFSFARRWKIRRLDRRYARYADKAVAAYRKLVRHLGTYAETFGSPFGPLLINESARRIINERLGERSVPPPPPHTLGGDGVGPHPPYVDLPPDDDAPRRRDSTS